MELTYPAAVVSPKIRVTHDNNEECASGGHGFYYAAVRDLVEPRPPEALELTRVVKVFDSLFTVSLATAGVG